MTTAYKKGNLKSNLLMENPLQIKNWVIQTGYFPTESAQHYRTSRARRHRHQLGVQPEGFESSRRAYTGDFERCQRVAAANHLEVGEPNAGQPTGQRAHCFVVAATRYFMYDSIKMRSFIV